MNKDFYDGLTPEEQYVIDYAARAAVDSGRGISRMIEASDRGLPQLAKKMTVNSVSAAELKKFADASQPAVKQLIADKFGAEGTEMLNAMLAAIAAASK